MLSTALLVYALGQTVAGGGAVASRAGCSPRRCFLPARS